MRTYRAAREAITMIDSQTNPLAGSILQVLSLLFCVRFQILRDVLKLIIIIIIIIYYYYYYLKLFKNGSPSAMS